MSSDRVWTFPEFTQVNCQNAPFVPRIGTALRLTRLYCGNLPLATTWLSMYLASVSMLGYVCAVRSIFINHPPPGALKYVALPERCSVQPGGTAMLKPADVPVADGWTVSWVQPAGIVLDGSSSACTDPGRFALAELLACVLAELLAAGGGDPELLPFRANAAPAPTAAATTTAAPINAMVRPRRFRPAGRRGPPVPA